MDSEAKNNENSYRNILKGTSIFGGVQVFQILINLLRGKFVAMFLGPQGMGVASLFTSSSNTIGTFASLGLNLAFVKEIASNKENPHGLRTVVRVANILLYSTAVLGALICALLSSQLSLWSFGTTDYTWQYLLLSVAIFFNIAGYGKTSLLQGLHRIKILSLSSLAGAAMGLLAGVPLYYFYGTLGIVPAIIVLGVTNFVCNTYGMRRALPRRDVRLRWKTLKPVMKRIVSMGLILLSSSLINTLFVYLINIFIRAKGNIADVGLFNAANSVTMQYAGVVFTAMALDYFPRLSAAINDNQKMGMIINRQMEIVALIASPLTILIVVTAPFVIRLLLTAEFEPSMPLMRWLGTAIILRAIAYPLGYVTFAKNNRKLFFWLEAVTCNVVYLALSIIFYYFYGLIGLGYAAVIEQAFCVILYLAVNYRAYSFKPGRTASTETILAIVFCTAAFCASLAPIEALSYYLMATVFLICALRSFLMLRNLSLK